VLREAQRSNSSGVFLSKKKKADKGRYDKGGKKECDGGGGGSGAICA